jgi:hypothetical protein
MLFVQLNCDAPVFEQQLVDYLVGHCDMQNVDILRSRPSKPQAVAISIVPSTARGVVKVRVHAGSNDADQIQRKIIEDKLAVLLNDPRFRIVVEVTANSGRFWTVAENIGPVLSRWT